MSRNSESYNDPNIGESTTRTPKRILVLTPPPLKTPALQTWHYDVCTIVTPKKEEIEPFGRVPVIMHLLHKKQGYAFNNGELEEKPFWRRQPKVSPSHFLWTSIVKKKHLCLISLYLSLQPRCPNHDLLKSHPWETNSQAALLATLKFPIAKKNLVSVTVRNLIQ